MPFGSVLVAGGQVERLMLRWVDGVTLPAPTESSTGQSRRRTPTNPASMPMSSSQIFDVLLPEPVVGELATRHQGLQVASTPPRVPHERHARHGPSRSPAPTAAAEPVRAPALNPISRGHAWAPPRQAYGTALPAPTERVGY